MQLSGTGRQESRFQRRGAGPSHDSRDGPRQPQVTRKTILITAGLEAEAGDLHRREAAWNAGVRIVVRVAATSVSPLAKVVVDAPVGFERHLRLLDYVVISVGRRLPP